MGSFLVPPGSSSASSGGAVGPAISFSSPSGSINPSITGFVAGTAGGTGRVKITLSANTTWLSLPAGADGQQLYLVIVAGNFILTLAHLSGSATQAPIFASSDFLYVLRDTAQLFYDSSLSDWVLVA